MHRLNLIVVGSLKFSWIKAGCAEYAERIAHDARLELVDVAASSQKDPTKQSEEECAAILKRLEKTDGEIWILDETGQEMPSEKFAAAIGALMDRGTPVTFVLGGAFGLTDGVRQRGTRVMRLSAMTFPHELCRLIVLEQLYRALQIRKGTGYHH